MDPQTRMRMLEEFERFNAEVFPTSSTSDTRPNIPRTDSPMNHYTSTQENKTESDDIKQQCSETEELIDEIDKLDTVNRLEVMKKLAETKITNELQAKFARDTLFNLLQEMVRITDCYPNAQQNVKEIVELSQKMLNPITTCSNEPVNNIKDSRVVIMTQPEPERNKSNLNIPQEIWNVISTPPNVHPQNREASQTKRSDYLMEKSYTPANEPAYQANPLPNTCPSNAYRRDPVNNERSYVHSLQRQYY